jgi:valyl-tRNA synthetase
MDTWATSSMTPQIVGQWLPGDNGRIEGLYERVFPYTLRVQAHEIIRTWAFYTIAKSHFHFNTIPWRYILISGWGIAGEGMGKISKSRGGGPVSPLKMIERYSADAVRYWAASTGPGKDSVISEAKIKMGAKLVNKLWNVARFSQRFLLDYQRVEISTIKDQLTPADHWILASVQFLIQRVTESLEEYEYAAAKSEIETFFWRDLADNYLEMSKQRLYDSDHPQHEAARFSLFHVLLDTIKLFAPYLPYVTEEIYRNLFAADDHTASIHRTSWPTPQPELADKSALELGEILVEVATAVRRYKSENNLSLGSELKRLQLVVADPEIGQWLETAAADLRSITRATNIEFSRRLDVDLAPLHLEGPLQAAIKT